MPQALRNECSQLTSDDISPNSSFYEWNSSVGLFILQIHSETIAPEFQSDASSLYALFYVACLRFENFQDDSHAIKVPALLLGDEVKIVGYD